MSKEQNPAAGAGQAEGKTPANQTDESAGGAIKGPQKTGNQTPERWDIAQGSEPATGGSARRR